MRCTLCDRFHSSLLAGMGCWVSEILNSVPGWKLSRILWLQNFLFISTQPTFFCTRFLPQPAVTIYNYILFHSACLLFQFTSPFHDSFIFKLVRFLFFLFILMHTLSFGEIVDLRSLKKPLQRRSCSALTSESLPQESINQPFPGHVNCSFQRFIIWVDFHRDISDHDGSLHAKYQVLVPKLGDSTSVVLKLLDPRHPSVGLRHLSENSGSLFSLIFLLWENKANSFDSKTLEKPQQVWMFFTL